MYASNNGPSHFIKTDRTMKRNESAIIVRDFNTSLSTVRTSTKWVRGQKTWTALLTKHKSPYPTTELTLFSSVQGWFININYILGHKTTVNKY